MLVSLRGAYFGLAVDVWGCSCSCSFSNDDGTLADNSNVSEALVEDWAALLFSVKLVSTNEVA